MLKYKTNSSHKKFPRKKKKHKTMEEDKQGSKTLNWFWKKSLLTLSENQFFTFISMDVSVFILDRNDFFHHYYWIKFNLLNTKISIKTIKKNSLKIEIYFFRLSWWKKLLKTHFKNKCILSNVSNIFTRSNCLLCSKILLCYTLLKDTIFC